VLSHAHERTRGPLHSGGYRSLFLGSDELIPVSAADKNGQPIRRLCDASKSAPLPLLITAMNLAWEASCGRCTARRWYAYPCSTFSRHTWRQC
jgi:hypothetical protein